MLIFPIAANAIELVIMRKTKVPLENK
jgi:hypothetical protein